MFCFLALRNAVSHGSCIVNGFGSSGELAGYRPNELITDSLNTAGMRNTKTRQSEAPQSSNVSDCGNPLHVGCALPDRGTRTRHAIYMNDVRVYAESQSHLFSSNDNVKYSFDFIWKLVDVWILMR